MIWWRAITPSRPKQLGLALVLLTGLLAGCGSKPEVEASLPNAGVVPPVAPAPETAVSAAPPPSLTPLPTTEQVQGSVNKGRTDPFAPLVSVGTGAGASATGAGGQPSAASITLQGVLAVGGQLQALVSTAAGSGAICLGPGGQCTADQVPLLPKQWSVLKIDLQRGCFTYAVEGKVQPPVCMTSPKA